MVPLFEAGEENSKEGTGASMATAGLVCCGVHSSPEPHAGKNAYRQLWAMFKALSLGALGELVRSQIADARAECAERH